MACGPEQRDGGQAGAVWIGVAWGQVSPHRDDATLFCLVGDLSQVGLAVNIFEVDDERERTVGDGWAGGRAGR